MEKWKTLGGAILFVALLLSATRLNEQRLQPISISTNYSSNLAHDAANLTVETYGRFDQRCFHPMPRDMLCLEPFNASGNCSLFFRRFSQHACVGRESSGELCPCRKRKSFVVKDVVLASTFTAGAFPSTLVAFSQNRLSWDLVDGSSAEFCALPCMYGIRALRQQLGAVYNMFHALSGAPSTLPAMAHATEPWSCSSLAHVSSRSGEVFYALDRSVSSPGHSSDLLMFALGLYFSEGLDVPWVVPCSDGWSSTTAWAWTRFFVELNEVLKLPVFALDIRYLTINMFGVHKLPSVRFAPYYLGWNQACLRPTVARILWPHARNTAATRDKQLWRISFLKVLFPNNVSSMQSPQRAFLYSLRFFQMLKIANVTVVSPTLTLLERMWHVNTAELVITTWGSAMAIAASLLIPQGNRSHRLLVLIHPGYCLEASRLLRSRKKSCSSVAARGPSRIFRGSMRVRDGATTDFDGGPGFCAKFLVVGALRFVRASDVEFKCS